jgi:hypothetical protein
MGLAMMQADDFNRGMNSIETALSLTPVIPIIWLLLIVGAWVFGRIKNRSHNHRFESRFGSDVGGKGDV